MAKLGSNLLDDFTIKAAKPTDKLTPLRDGNGLWLLVHDNGSKYFQLRTTLHCKRKLIQLGKYPQLSLSDAREMARVKSEQFKTDHIDPVLLKKKEKESKAVDADNTFKRIAEDWRAIKSRTLTMTSHKKLQQTFTANVYGMLGKYPNTYNG